jgi:flagellar hook assembly protein FlgD
VFTLDVGTAVEEQQMLPTEYVLAQSYPNPFNATTVIEFAIPEAALVRLDVYNVLGRRVKTLVQGTQPAGFYRTVWDGRDEAGHPVPTGLYLYRLTASDWIQTRRMMLIK